MNKTTLTLNFVSNTSAQEDRERWEQFKLFNAMMQEQEERRIATARNAVVSSDVPLSDEVRSRLLELRLEDAHDILRLHPGYKASEALKSMVFAVSLFNKSISDYLVRAEQFCRRSSQTGFFDKVNDTNVNDLNLSVAKEIYAVSFYSKLLIDQARRLRGVVSIDGYEEMLKSTIDANNAHSFIVELRNMVSHELVVPHGYSMSLGRNDSKTLLEFSAKTLLQNDWNTRAREYINSSSGKINITDLYCDYAKSVNIFYSWWLSEIEINKSVAAQDYDSLERAIKSRNFNQSYKVIITFAINNKKDPYKYLEKYIHEDALKEILELPKESKLQVDAIIAYADSDGLCDGELKKLLYKLFKVQDS